MKKAGNALQHAQARYKRNYDQRLRRRRNCLTPGGYAFLRIEKSSESSFACRHKLAPIADGPFRIITVKEQTIVIERPDGNQEEVSLDRVEYAPPPVGVQIDSSMGNVNEKVEQPQEEEFYVVDRIVNHRQESGVSEGHLKYKVKWYGHDNMT